jgi:Flp pilus assembly protein TadG
MVEFALSLLLMLFLIFAVFDIGRIFWQYVTLSQATGHATRWAAVHGSKSASPVGPGGEATVKAQIADDGEGAGTDRR